MVVPAEFTAQVTGPVGIMPQLNTVQEIIFI